MKSNLDKVWLCYCEIISDNWLFGRWVGVGGAGYSFWADKICCLIECFIDCIFCLQLRISVVTAMTREVGHKINFNRNSHVITSC